MKGYVYLIEELGAELKYKIGFTKNDPNLRLRSIKTGNSNNVRVLKMFQSEYYIKIERMVHRKFVSERYKGEWFVLNDEQVNNFISECEIAHENIDYLVKNNTFYK